MLFISIKERTTGVTIRKGECLPSALRHWDVAGLSGKTHKIVVEGTDSTLEGEIRLTENMFNSVL